MKIIQLNSFGAPRASYKSSITDPSGKKNGEPKAHTTCGIWPIASRINHSCVTNCRRSFIGDMMIVRACKNMEAGTELYFGYHHPLANETFEETQKKLGNWGFICGCALCLEKKSTSRNTVRERETLRRSLALVLKPSASMAQLTQAMNILENLEKTYTSRQNAPLLPRIELWDPYFALGYGLVAKGKLADGLEMLLKGLEALGYVIVACPPREVSHNKNKKKAMLEIKRWGDVVEVGVEIFLAMMHTYRELAPELCNVAKEYAGVFYSICYGEKETIGAHYPDLS